MARRSGRVCRIAIVIGIVLRRSPRLAPMTAGEHCPWPGTRRSSPSAASICPAAPRGLVHRGLLPPRFHPTRLEQTVIPHKTELVDRPPTAGSSGCGRGWKTASWSITRSAPAAMRSISGSSRPTRPRVESQAHWAQPCIRVNRYAGTKAEHGSEAYLPRCFIYVDGRPVRMPTKPGPARPSTRPGRSGVPRASAAMTSTPGRSARSSRRTG